MTRHSYRLLALTAALTVGAFPAMVFAQAQPARAMKSKAAMPTTGLRAELLKDVADVEKKYIQLAGAMTGKHGWRPADKTRTFGEVLMHIAGENYALPIVLGVKAPEGFASRTMDEAFGSAAAMEKVTDEAEVKAALDKSFAHLRLGIASLSEKDMNKPVEVFGMKTTRRGFLVLIVTHMHEHLGQVVAYARMNGVMPPWSATSGG